MTDGERLAGPSLTKGFIRRLGQIVGIGRGGEWSRRPHEGQRFKHGWKAVDEEPARSAELRGGAEEHGVELPPGVAAPEKVRRHRGRVVDTQHAAAPPPMPKAPKVRKAPGRPRTPVEVLDRVFEDMYPDAKRGRSLPDEHMEVFRRVRSEVDRGKLDLAQAAQQFSEHAARIRVRTPEPGMDPAKIARLQESMSARRVYSTMARQLNYSHHTPPDAPYGLVDWAERHGWRARAIRGVAEGGDGGRYVTVEVANPATRETYKVTWHTGRSARTAPEHYTPLRRVEVGNAQAGISGGTARLRTPEDVRARIAENPVAPPGKAGRGKSKATLPADRVALPEHQSVFLHLLETRGGTVASDDKVFPAAVRDQLRKLGMVRVARVKVGGKSTNRVELTDAGRAWLAAGRRSASRPSPFPRPPRRTNEGPTTPGWMGSGGPISGKATQADLLKVGPKGYIHGWIFVGVPVPGGPIHHPELGHGAVRRVGKRTATVRFDAGHEHAFEHGAAAPQSSPLTARFKEVDWPASVLEEHARGIERQLNQPDTRRPYRGKVPPPGFLEARIAHRRQQESDAAEALRLAAQLREQEAARTPAHFVARNRFDGDSPARLKPKPKPSKGPNPQPVNPGHVVAPSAAGAGSVQPQLRIIGRAKKGDLAIREFTTSHYSTNAKTGYETAFELVRVASADRDGRVKSYLTTRHGYGIPARDTAADRRPTKVSERGRHREIFRIIQAGSIDEDAAISATMANRWHTDRPVDVQNSGAPYGSLDEIEAALTPHARTPTSRPAKKVAPLRPPKQKAPVYRQRAYKEPAGWEPGAVVSWVQRHRDSGGATTARSGRVWSDGPEPNTSWVIPDERLPTDPYAAILVHRAGRRYRFEPTAWDSGHAEEVARLAAERHRTITKVLAFVNRQYRQGILEKALAVVLKEKTRQRTRRPRLGSEGVIHGDRAQ